MSPQLGLEINIPYLLSLVDCYLVKLKAWIEAFKAEVVLISDYPKIDWPFIWDLFEAHGWPKNLRKQFEPIHFWLPEDTTKFQTALQDFWSKHESQRHNAGGCQQLAFCVEPNFDRIRLTPAE